MKKLLILLLFFGFSFGQDIKSELIGTWKVINIEQSYVFLKNGTGYWSWINKNKNNENMNSKFSWIVIDSEKSDSYDFTLIREFEDVDLTLIDTFFLVKKENVDNEMIKNFFPEGIKWNGGDVIVWWDSKLKTWSTYTLLERY